MKITIKTKGRQRIAPELVMSLFRGADQLKEHIAIEALVGGYAEVEHFDNLLTAIHILRFGAALKRNRDAEGMGKLAEIAMENILARRETTKKFGASGDELKALRAFKDFEESWWKLQGGSTRTAAVASVNSWHNSIKRSRAKVAA